MASNSLQELDSLINCCKCNQEYSRKRPPVTLLCGHNICKLCAQRIHKRSGMIKCPIEYQQRKLPELKINVDFLNFIETLKQAQIKIPKKRKRYAEKGIQCNMRPSPENWSEKLREMQEKYMNLMQWSNIYNIMFGLGNLITIPMNFDQNN